jgi:hypothetical protein
LGFFEGLRGLICLEDCRFDYLDSNFLLGYKMLSKIDLSEASLTKRL